MEVHLCQEKKKNERKANYAKNEYTHMSSLDRLNMG